MVNIISSNQKPMAAFIISLLSGTFIILGSVIWSFWWGPHWDMGWMEDMIHGWEGNMNAWNLGGIAYALSIVGMFLGLIVIIATVMLYMNPMRNELWGALIIVFSVISIFTSMGGLVVEFGSRINLRNHRRNTRDNLETRRNKTSVENAKNIFMPFFSFQPILQRFS
jgi:hypothetical protein